MPVELHRVATGASGAPRWFGLDHQAFDLDRCCAGQVGCGRDAKRLPDGNPEPLVQARDRTVDLKRRQRHGVQYCVHSVVFERGNEQTHQTGTPDAPCGEPRSFGRGEEAGRALEEIQAKPIGA